VTIHAGNRVDVLGPLSVRVIPGVGAQMERRLNSKGFFTIADLFAASKNDMHGVWESVVGDRYYDWLHGGTAPRIVGENKSLGHQHVLEPKFRNRESAIQIIKKLLIRATARLRRKGFYAKRMYVSIRWVGQGVHDTAPLNWDVGCNLQETNDPIVLLRELDRLLSGLPDRKPLRVGISFAKLVPKDQHQFSFFENPKREALLDFVDKINQRYGKESITFASIHDLDAAGTAKIAFSNIPDKEDL
jgi:DNA polymerase IV